MLRTLLANDSAAVPQNTWIDKLGAKHAEELASGQFKMKLKSDRYWHSLQNIKRERKAEFWSRRGYGFNYDIEACAPTVLQQLARQLAFH